MVKECLVVLNNEAVTVVKYDDTNIQFPSINKDAKKVFVNCENGKYSIVDEKYKAKSVEKPKKKNNTNLPINVIIPKWTDAILNLPFFYL